MNFWQSIVVVLLGFYSLSGFLLGLKHRKNPFGLTPYYNIIGAFIWTDTIVFGLFFFLVSLFCIIFQQFLLFLIILSVFWTIRAIGEQIYWFLEQFASNHRNPPHTLWPSKLFKGQEVWVVMQVFWQCISVVGIILSVWLLSLFLV